MSMPLRDHPLPVLLCGPIVRFASRRALKLWVATSVPLEVSGRVLQPPESVSSAPDDWPELGSGRASPYIQLGRFLYLTVVSIEGTYPPERILAYDLEFHAPEGHVFSDEGGLVEQQDLVYGWPLPTFIAAVSGARLELLHGSCRKLHGPGVDAILTADEHLASLATDAGARPAVFLFTGDQIYADDVHQALGPGLAHAGELLTGFHEFMSADENVPAAARGRYPRQLSWARETDSNRANRQGVLRDGNVGFTFDIGIEPYHLMSFGEYAAMYLLAWSPELWRHDELRELATFFRPREASIRTIRRVMANTASYMMMDDHELSDDVPIGEHRFQTMLANRLGRWIVANAWSAFWAFQLIGIGHAAAETTVGGNLRNYVRAGLTMGMVASPTPAFEEARDNYSYNVSRYGGGFTYVTPTNPRIIMLDTRTRRALGAGPPALLNGGALAQLASLSRRRGRSSAPLLVVSPAPVLGVTLLESLQESHGATPAYDRDPEAWSMNADAFYRFLRTLEDSGHETAVIFSGDVHYGSVIEGHFHALNDSGGGLRFAQLTSSALCNQPSTGLQWALAAVERLEGSAPIQYFQRGQRGYQRAGLPFSYRDEHGVEHYAHEARYLYAAFHRAAGFGWLHASNNVGIVSISWGSRVVVSQRLVGPPPARNQGANRAHPARITLIHQPFFCNAFVHPVLYGNSIDRDFL